MMPHERELSITKIISGIIKCEFEGNIYLINEPSTFDKMLAEEIYHEKLRDASFLEIHSADDLIDILIKNQLWSEQEQIELDSLPKRIEEMKLALWNSYSKWKSREAIKKNLGSLKTRFLKLTIKRECLRRESRDGLALTCKNKFLICSNITYLDRQKVWDSKDYYKQRSDLIDAIVDAYMKNQVEDSVIRELSRNEPWRSVWGAAKSNGDLFGIPAINLTQDQRVLVTWSRIYDNVFENNECPDDEVIQDDDVLDGWFIAQARKRDKSKKEAEGEQIGAKHKNAEEVFLFADNPEDAQRIYGMNTAQAVGVMRQRAATLQRSGGAVQADKMPDAQLKLREMAIQGIRAKARK